MVYIMRFYSRSFERHICQHVLCRSASVKCLPCYCHGELLAEKSKYFIKTWLLSEKLSMRSWCPIFLRLCQRCYHDDSQTLDYKVGLISLWLYKENKLWDWKKCFYIHLWLCSNFNPSKKNSFACAANGKTENRKSYKDLSATYVSDTTLHQSLWWS
jgi:hypothetical protein